MKILPNDPDRNSKLLVERLAAQTKRTGGRSTIEDSDITTGSVTIVGLDSSISDNSSTQMKVTAYDSSGREGIGLIDGYGWSVENTPMDELRAVIPTRLAGTTFIGTTVDSNYVATVTANNGSATQANCQITLATSTTADGSVSISTVKKAIYNGGSSNRFRGIVRLPDTGTTDNTRKWGAFDGTDGAYFKLAGTALSVCTLKGSSETAVAQAAWDNPSGFTLNTNVHTYEIYYTNSHVYFSIDDVLVHTVHADSTTWSDTTNLPAMVSNVNSGGSTTNVTMEVRVFSIYRMGQIETQPTTKYQSGTTAGLICKYGAGILRGIVFSAVSNNSVITLYDNTAASGTVLWASGTLPALTTPFDLPFYGMQFSTGLTLVISGAASNVTLIYE